MTRIRGALPLAGMVVLTGMCATMAQRGKKIYWSRPVTNIEDAEYLDPSQFPPEGCIKNLTVGHSWSCIFNHYDHEVCWGKPGVRERKIPGPEDCGVPPPHKCGPYKKRAFAKGPPSASVSCVIRDDDSVQCFGFDPSGRSINIGVDKLPYGKFKSVHPGGWTSCAIDILDKLHCWGPPERANLGAPEDYLIGLDGYFRQVSVGNKHMCTVSRSTPIEYIAKGGECGYDCGQLRCWGVDVDGQIRSKPPPLPGDKPLTPQYYYVRQVTCGWDHTCFISDSDHIFCWGFNAYGEVEAPKEQGWQVVKCGFDHCCAVLRDNKTIACWGRDQRQQTDVPRHYDLCSKPIPPTPTPTTIEERWPGVKLRYSYIKMGAAPCGCTPSVAVSIMAAALSMVLGTRTGS